jgi:alpha-tubulin suppressor-like RCC1 family protein
MLPISGKAIDIDTGNNLSVVLTDDGTVWAWGDNSAGQLGKGNTVGLSTPLKVGSLEKIVAISCGAQHALALAENGDLWAWGWNIMGQLGDRSFGDRAEPVRVTLKWLWQDVLSPARRG